jgi:replicative DNA helicase
MTNNGDRTPQHDAAAERVALGAMMLTQNVIPDVTDLVSPNDYYLPKHATIHRAITHNYAHDTPTDVIAVADRLQNTGDLNRIGGANYLDDCIACVPIAAQAAWYARKIADTATLRRLVHAGTHIVQVGETPTDDIAAAVDHAQQTLHQATTGRTTTDPIRVGTLMADLMDRIEAAGNHTGHLRGLSTGLADLDRLTTGLRPGQLVIVAGRPGLGKSVFGIDLLRQTAIKANRPALHFSIEMGRDEIVDRIASAEARIPYTRIRDGKLSDGDWARLATVIGRDIDPAPLFLDDTAGLTLADIRGKARRIQQRHGLDLIVVDYLQIMTTAGRSDNRARELAELSGGLKVLARELDIPIVAICQLNRGPEMRQDKRPQLSDLRESGCMPASTRLLRADNGQEITLGELLLTQAQPTVLAVDDHYRLVPSRLTRTFPSGIKPVFRLSLASGRQVEATANHRFLTVDGWTRLDELSPDVAIAVPRILPPPAVPDEWDADRLVLLAHLIGDGSIGPSGVKYATADPANKAAVEQSAERAFGIKVSGKPRGRTWQLWLPSPTRLTHNKVHPVRQWLGPLGLWGSRSGNKFIPEPLFALPDQQLALFLRHLWATDGSITIGRNARGQTVRVYYASTSRRLAENVQRALLRFEIRSRLYPTTKYGYGQCWNVVVQGSGDQIRFLRTIGCHGERGNRIPEALGILGGLKPNPNVDLVPWSVSARVKDAMAKVCLTHREVAERLGERYAGSYMLGSEGRPRRFSRGRLERIAEMTGSGELMDLATSHIYWDAVVSIEPLGEMPVFDATVEGTHNFIANGVVAHNSIEQDADIVILLYREDYYDRESPRAGEADFIVAKHRAGPTDTITVAAQLHLQRFVDMAIDAA